MYILLLSADLRDVVLRSMILLAFSASFTSVRTAIAQPFQFPVDGGIFTQDYAKTGPDDPNNNEFHTGNDIFAAAGTPVLAVAAGTVVERFDSIGHNDNHCMGNVVIIDHSGTFTLYAHLQSIDVAKNNDPIDPGDQIGTVGRTGYDENSREGCQSNAGPHLHFEVKERSVLHNPTYLGDNTPDNQLCTEEPPCYWGYTPTPPNQHGYRDPLSFLHPIISINPPVPIEVTAGGNDPDCPFDTRPLTVRKGPDQDYYPPITSMSIDVGRQFVAFNKSGDWYQIHLPVPQGADGVIDGWVRDCYVQETPTADQVEIKNAGIPGKGVWSTTSTEIGTPLARVWDEQRFVRSETQQPANGLIWYKIDLPNNAGQTSGWVNSEWGDCLSCQDPSPPATDPIAIQNEEVLAISGTFSGFGGSLLNNMGDVMGDVVFSAGVDTDNDGLSEVTGIFKESQGVKSKIVATGENTPTDIGTLNFLDVTLDDFNDDGDIVFSGIWDQPAGVRHNGIFLVSGSTITNLFQSGEQITISDGTGEFTVVENGAINEQGDLAFTATVSIAVTIPSTSHIFLALSGCRQTNCLIDAAKRGEPTGIPGVGGTFDGFHAGTGLFLTANGDVVFRTIINGGETSVAYLLFDHNNHTLKKIVAAGDEVAGTGVLNGVSSAAVAPIGRMAFLGKFDEPSPTSGGQLQGAYYINDVYSNVPPNQKIVRVIEEGDQIPGKDETLTLFSTGTTQVSVNGNGAVVFNARFFGANPLNKNSAVFVWTSESFVQRALEGDCAPVGGAYGGVSDPHINNAGKVTFFNPNIGAANGCSSLAANSLSPPRPPSLWAQIGKVSNVLFPSLVHAQSAGTSNIGEFATISPLDPIPDVCGGGPFERSDDWFLMDEDVTGVKNYKATYGIDAGPGFTITANGCAAFSASEGIILYPGFRVEQGGRFIAIIE